MNIRRELEQRLSAAMGEAVGQDAPAMVAPSAKPQFGDYQANGVMSAAKRLKTNPRELAEKVVAAMNLSDLAKNLEVAGPGFINITLKDDFLCNSVGQLLQDDRLGVERPAKPQVVVVDYSAPNLAKEMHVGHLRSTIIGDALARVLDFLGHNVIRQNHVGDWGTQFGMLAAYMVWRDYELPASGDSLPISDMEEFYREAKRLYDENQEFAQKARKYVVQLQQGDEGAEIIWGEFVWRSLDHCEEIYKRLNVSLTRDDIRGESAYNDDLPKVVEALKDKGLLTESEGAQCVFLDEFKNKDKDNEPLPVIVRKSDGGYLYATTDLAAIRYRVGKLKAKQILYVTDSRQALHFRQIFAVARAAGFAPESVSLEHVPFGTMMGKDNRPFKTREGGTVKLMDLLDSAERQALGLVNTKSSDLPDEQKREIARIVGIGAVKYSDLAHNRTSDYVFSWDKMLALDGNTAPYMQYAYARIRSIFRKGEEPASRDRKPAPLGGAEIVIEDPAERALAAKLLQFAETVEAVAAESLPHLLCGYLFDLAGAFTTFYESCPVLKSDEPTRSSRLALCEATGRTIRTGLGLLGIETVEQM